MTPDIHDIKEAIHGQKAFVYPEEDLIFVWNGSSRVNIYNGAFEPLDTFGFSQNPENEYEVIDSIESYIKTNQMEELPYN